MLNEIMFNLFIIDFFSTVGVILGITIHMKRTGDTFQETCLKIRNAIFRK